MSDDLAVPNKRTLVWIIVAVPFAVGLYLGLTRPHPTIEPLIKPSVALVFVLAGIGSLFGSRTDQSHKTRTRVWAIALMVVGLAQVIPSFKLSTTLIALAVLCMLAAARGIPKRLFAP